MASLFARYFARDAAPPAAGFATPDPATVTLAAGTTTAVPTTVSPAVTPAMLARKRTIVFLGAGATKACGGPLTGEILPKAFELLAAPSADRANDAEAREFGSTVRRFLIDSFHLPEHPPYQIDDFPPLPMLLSTLDNAIAAGETLGEGWTPERLDHVRMGLEYMIFIVLEDALKLGQHNPHLALFSQLARTRGADVAVISLNYDIICDNSILEATYNLPDYLCRIATPEYYAKSTIENYDKQGQLVRWPLLKLHGSCNWMCCPKCGQFEVNFSKHDRLFEKFTGNYFKPEIGLDGKYTWQGMLCTNADCGGRVRPIMITPSNVRHYENAYLAGLWANAAEILRNAERVHFIGYSMPPEDTNVIYLLKRSLSHLPPDRISVVEHGRSGQTLRQNAVGQRYRALFGDRIDWHPDGFAQYVDRVCRAAD